MNAISNAPPSMRLSAWLRCMMRVGKAVEDVHGVVISVQEHRQRKLLQGVYEYLATMTGDKLTYVDERLPIASLFDAYDAELARLSPRLPAAECHPLRLIGAALPGALSQDGSFNAERTGDLIARAMVIHIRTIDVTPRPASGFMPTFAPRLSDNGLSLLGKVFFAGMVPALLALLTRINERSSAFNQIEAAKADAQPIFSTSFVEERYRMPPRPLMH